MALDFSQKICIILGMANTANNEKAPIIPADVREWWKRPFYETKLIEADDYRRALEEIAAWSEWNSHLGGQRMRQIARDALGLDREP